MMFCVYLKIPLFFLILFYYNPVSGESLRRIVPTNIEVREGEEMQLRLTQILKNEISCYVRTPTRENCNLLVEEESKCDERISYWSPNGECGAVIKNIKKEDAGWWHLTTKDDQRQQIKDAAEVTVLEKYNANETDISLASGFDYRLDFADVNKYCLVKHPQNAVGNIIEGDCAVELTRTSADNGTWSAIVGVSGQVKEVVKTKNVFIYHEQLHSGYNRSSDSKSLNLFCNFMTGQAFNICRFSKMGMNQTGFRLTDGLKNGRYGYYGNGLALGQCGLTIESPENDDFGQWYCTVGAENAALLGATIYIHKDAQNSTDYTNKAPRTWSVTPVLSAVTKEFNIECYTNLPLKYCWFSRPDGHILRPSKPVLVDNDIDNPDSFNYIHQETIGKCAVVIQDAKMEYSGEWTCHMGPELLGVELTQNVTVRVAETPLAAVHVNVTIENIDAELILACKTVPRVVALQYCRFFSPNGFGININEHVTRAKPITYNDIQYWFAGRSLSAGDCGVVISKANSEDAGEWTCAAKLEHQEEEEEILDTIHVTYEVNLENQTIIAATGIVLGVLVIIITVGITIGIVMKKLNINIPSVAWWRRRNARDDIRSADGSYLSAVHFASARSSDSTNSSTEDRR